jgi:hypothetical protein
MARDALKPLAGKKKELQQAHAEERQRMARGQRERWQRETKERASRLRTGEPVGFMGALERHGCCPSGVKCRQPVHGAELHKE